VNNERSQPVVPTSDSLGVGFAWAMKLRSYWVINQPYAGAHLFVGTELQAEEHRCYMARREMCVTHKRQASYSDLDTPSTCWNHRGFTRVMTKTLRGKPRKRPFVYTMFCDCRDCHDKGLGA
jgi:hypothetical protein